jgi:DNA-binding ferritin-like protein (Dps family)
MNQNLGQYQMVLALSVNKINSQFAFLHQCEIIPSNWSLLCDKDGKQVSKPDPEEPQEEDVFFTQRLAAWKGTTASVTNPVNHEVETTQSLRQKYKFAADTEIEAPLVELISGDSTRLKLILKINSGNIMVENNGQLTTYDVSRTQYVFVVPLNQRVVKKADIELGNDELEEQLTATITDDLFRIESLYIDFQRSKSLLPDEKSSIFPTDATASGAVKLLLSAYFQSLSAEKNPYVLGYSVNRKVALKKADALFEPTYTSFSTTYHNLIGNQSLNFMMQTGGATPPASNQSGIIGESLLKQRIDTSNTVNGVLGIDFEVFCTKYVNDVIQKQIVEKLKGKIAAVFNGMEVTENWLNEGEFSFRLRKHNLEFSISYLNRQIRKRDQSNKAIGISWDLVVKGSAHNEVQKKILFINTGTIGMDQRFSTNGRFSLSSGNEEHGKTGLFELILMASAKGTIEMEEKYTPPKIAKDTASPEYSNSNDRLKDELFRVAQFMMLDIRGIMEGIENMTNFKLNLNAADFDSLLVDDLNSFASHIILPGSNTYAFKNIRLMDEGQHNKSAILFDIAYAPEN